MGRLADVIVHEHVWWLGCFHFCAGNKGLCYVTISGGLLCMVL